MSASNLKQLGVSVIQSLNAIEKLHQIPDFSQQLRGFQGRFEDNEFRIAVVGEYSTGKSTFLNALIGNDVLSHASRETTAVITRIVNVSAEDPRCGTGQVNFHNRPPLMLNNISDLKQYTTTYSSLFNVAAEVDSVEIYYSVLGNDADVVFVDTPGLNGTAEGHYERTAELVKHAHTCIYLLQLHGLKETDKSFLRILSQYQKHFIFVVNRIDELKSSEGDDLNQILATQEKILREKVFPTDENIQFEICGISSLQALVYKDRTIDRIYANSTQALTEDARASLLTSSNFQVFSSILARTLEEENKLRIKYEDTIVALYIWIQNLRRSVAPHLKYYQEEFEASKEGRTIHRLEKQKDTLLRSQDERKQNLRDHILASCLRYQKEENDLLQEELEDLNDHYQMSILSHTDVNSLEKWSKKLPADIRSSLNPIILEHRQRLQWQQQELYQRLIRKIEVYTNFTHQEISPEELTFATPDSPVSLLHLEQELQKERQIVINAEQKAAEATRLKISAKSLRESKQENFRNLQAEQASVSRLHQRQLDQQGPRPEPTVDYVRATRKVYRGGLGILDKIFGPKTEYYYKEVIDDSLGGK